MKHKSSVIYNIFLKIFSKKLKIQIMRKYLLMIVLIVIMSLNLNAQTNADFVFSHACFGDSLTLTSTSTSPNPILQTNWDIDSNGLFTDAATAIVKLKFAVDKNYVVGIQVITAVDTAVLYKTVDVYPKPVADFEIDFPKQCLSNFFTFTNKTTIRSGNMTYFWDLGDGSTTSIAKDTVHIYPATVATYNVKLVVTSDNFCKDSITKQTTIVDSSKADFSINDSVQCLVGNNFLFTNTSLLCDPLTSLSWDLNGDGVFGDSSNVDPLPHIITTPGTYKIGLKITTTVSTDSFYKFVTVNPSPAAGFTITSDSGQCLAGNSFTFNNSSILGGAGTLSYNWNMGDGSASTLIIPAPYSYSSSGTYMVKLIATSDKGCKDSINKNVRIYEQPSVKFSVSDTIACFTNTFNFNNLSAIASPWTLSYYWDFDDGSNSTATNPSQIYSSAGTYNVKLIATSDSNCKDSFTQSIYAISNTLARVGVNNDTQCIKGNAYIFTGSEITCNPVISTTWDLDNDGIFDDAITTIVNHNFTTAGVYNVGYKVVTSADSDSVYVQVVVLASPVAGFTVNDTTQEITVNNFIFTNSSTPAGLITYLWDFADGSTAPTKDVTKIYSVTGTYPVKLIVTHSNLCKDSLSQNVYVFSPIDAGFIANAVCDGDSMTFTDTTVSGSPITSVGWDFDNDLVPELFGKTIKYKFPATGTYNVGVFVTSTTSADTLYKNVVVNALPTAAFTSNEACQGATTTLTSTATSTDLITKYYWDFDNNGTVDDSSGAVVSTTYPTAGTKLIRHSVLTQKGCKTEIIGGIKVNNIPNPDFSFINVCDGDSMPFINNSTILTDSIINFLWDYGDGFDAIIRHDHKHYFLTPGTYTVTLTALTNKGCKASINKPVTVYPKPALTLTFSGPTTFYDGYNVIITATGVFDSTIWSTGAKTPAITVTKTGTYTVTVKDSNGCSLKDSASIVAVKVDEFIAVDIITPNGDNINDLWIVKDVGYFSPVEVSIYNRYGDLLYTSNDYKNDWDGKRDGDNLPEGAYYYIVRTKQGDVYKGTLNIIR